MGIKSYDEMKKIDLSKYIKQRDGADYINWATIIDLLHENGANVVYFEPVINEKTGISLFMGEETYTNKDGKSNKIYETAVKVVIDDLIFIQRGPVTNGSNPVLDNSMNQQRLWNCQCRLFVKGVAIRTGLGFSLWQKQEIENEKNDVYDDLSKHDIFKVKERVQELYTKIYKAGLSAKEIAGKLNRTEDEVKALFSYFDTLNTFERDLLNLDTKSR